MKAFEMTGIVDEKGQLVLDNLLEIHTFSRVKVIILVPEEESEIAPDDTPIEEIKASLRRALQEAKEGKTRPLSELWERIEDE
ncbi:hypothetical protein C7H19_21675 [Aphanothece hegewaldii CCALA 016]|uniref:Uncharacterized protein n=1 Tax=Aphanothece hegewaldii CCALA 016 TaxID=2107694 RepID=A0A2T1LS34_9CHRO|nr:hypothetical protein [Aphanothece hegewaldii]PSF32245.1 hypothetical protein C7H19_21675 [Aphanothece hegewaldii CCALA 016]